MRNFKQNKAVVIAIIITGIIIFVILDVFTAYLNEKISEENEVSAVKTNLEDYTQTVSESLSQDILYEDSNLILYEDRALMKFSYNQERIDYIKEVTEEMRGRYPQLEDIYVLPIPLRIVTEEGYSSYKQDYLNYLDQLNTIISTGSELIDVFPEIEKHQDEYVFFRTEDSWTGRGAYYGSVAFCNTIGIEPLKLEEYQEHTYNSFTGAFMLEGIEKQKNSGSSAVQEIIPDTVYYYLFPQGVNREKLRLVDSEEWIPQKTLAHSRKGLDTFVGTNWSEAVVAGDCCNKQTEDETILLICDERGQILAPFLANYYKNVYLINIYEKDMDYGQIMEKYKIKKVVWAQSALTMGDYGYCRSLNCWMQEE